MYSSVIVKEVKYAKKENILKAKELAKYLKMDVLTDTMAVPLQNIFPIVGLRYFNVYGPGEYHKGVSASMVYHLYKIK